MKSGLRRVAIVLALCVTVLVVMSSCTGCTQQRKKDDVIKYVILTEVGTRKAYNSRNDRRIELEYNADLKYYQFMYQAYYFPSGNIAVERGTHSGFNNTPGEHSVTIQNITEHWPQADRTYSINFTFVVPRAPDNRIMPELSFEPNGAVEFEDMVSYTYKYDGKEHYPQPVVMHDGVGIKLDDITYQFGGFHDGIPQEVGTYTGVRCRIRYRWEDDKLKYKSPELYITVIIIE